MTEINDITAKALQQLQPKKTSKRSTPKEESTAPAPREQDSVEIGGPTAVPEKSDVNVTEEELKRYTQLLQQMPDVRDGEVARVQAILEEDGYGTDVLSEVVDRIIEEEF